MSLLNIKGAEDAGRARVDADATRRQNAAETAFTKEVETAVERAAGNRDWQSAKRGAVSVDFMQRVAAELQAAGYEVQLQTGTRGSDCLRLRKVAQPQSGGYDDILGITVVAEGDAAARRLGFGSMADLGAALARRRG